jgi:diguanylate cyclase (GGDEF)-like protein/PAS domain S-box-containing protein
MLRANKQSGKWIDLNQNREIIQILANLMSEPLYEKNQDGFFVLCNQAFLDFFGVREEAVLATDADEFFLSRLKQSEPEFEMDMVQNGDVHEQEIDMLYHDGTFHRVQVSRIFFHDVDGEPSSLMGMFKDLTKQEQQDKDYAKLLRVRDAILEINNASLYVEPLDQLLEIILEKMLDMVEAAEIGTFLFRDETGHLTIRASRGYNQTAVQDFQLFPEDSFLWKYTNGHVTRTEIIELNPDSNTITPPLEKETSPFMIRSSISAPVFIEGELYGLINVDSDQSGVFKEDDREVMEFIRGQIEGVINRKRLYEQSERLSYYDLLTQIHNRRAFEKALNQAIEEERTFYLIMFDLDGLKWINDTYGHQQGDRFLKCMANQLREIEREGDTIARFGGDEFIAICYRQERGDILQELVQLEEYSRNNGLEIQREKVSCSFSYGVVQYPQDGDTETELVREADSRMYKYKRKYRRGR